jgi:hypothetical protein
MMSELRKIIFPRAFAFAIDDLGWNEGSNLSKNIPPGPIRAAVKRSFDLNDYKHIVEVGEKIGVRIQCLFILSEMDRENVLAKYPTTNHQREKWDNSKRVNDEQFVIMKYVIEQTAHMEFGFHGTGHEHWADDGIQRRAEWYNLADRKPWPEEILRNHIQAFREIMGQYGITPENGHSFPESFVPCAYGYYWNPDGAYSLGKLLFEAGVKYANTDFGQIPELSPPQEVNGGGFDHGIHVINRLNYGNHYFNLSTLPIVPLEMQGTDMVETHWPNWLAQDDFLQGEVTTQWINYYKSVQRMPNRYVAKNTEQIHSQWLYNKYTTIAEKKSGKVEIDNTNMPNEAYRNDILGNLVLKIRLFANEHVSEVTLNNELIPAYFEDEGYAFLYLPLLKREKYELRYTVGNHEMPLYILNDSTYNVYDLKRKSNSILVDIKMYGKQFIKIKCSKPDNVVSKDKDLLVKNFVYNTLTGVLHIEVAASNVQGTRGVIEVKFQGTT